MELNTDWTQVNDKITDSSGLFVSYGVSNKNFNTHTRIIDQNLKLEIKEDRWQLQLT